MATSTGNAFKELSKKYFGPEGFPGSFLFPGNLNSFSAETEIQCLAVCPYGGRKQLPHTAAIL